MGVSSVLAGNSSRALRPCVWTDDLLEKQVLQSCISCRVNMPLFSYVSDLGPGRSSVERQSSVERPSVTPFAVDERGWGNRRALRRVLGCFLHREESPRTGIPIHDSGPRGLGHPDLLPPPTPGAGWDV